MKEGHGERLCICRFLAEKIGVIAVNGLSGLRRPISFECAGSRFNLAAGSKTLLINNGDWVECGSAAAHQQCGNAEENSIEP